MNIDCQKIQFKYADSSHSDKFSVHIISNYYFDIWITMCKFMKKDFSKELELGIIDKEICPQGGRAMRIIGSMKYGKNSFLTPIEIDQERNNRNNNIIADFNTYEDYLENYFIFSDIEQEPDLLEHMVCYSSETCYKINIDDKLFKKTVKMLLRK